MPQKVADAKLILEKYKSTYEKGDGKRIVYEFPIPNATSAFAKLEKIREDAIKTCTEYLHADSSRISDNAQVYVYNDSVLKIVSPVFYDEETGAKVDDIIRKVAERALEELDAYRSIHR